MPISQTWTQHSYTDNTFFGIQGYISGVNADDFTKQANYFNLSATSYNYILGAIVKFSKANSNVDTSFAKQVYFRVYADNNGTPGSELTTEQTRGQATLTQIKSDVTAARMTAINFPSPITIPAGKKFYVAVDFSNFKWFSPENHYDSICITSTGDNEVVNSAWNYDSDVSKWKSYTKAWTTPPDDLEPLDVSLYIFPYVSTASSGCGLLPVNLLSFTAELKNNDVALNWQVSNEINMKGYEVEKSVNNGVYKTIAFVPAINNLKNENYTAMDKNAFAKGAAAQYRLKQIDADGSVKYSNVITLHSSGVDVVFQNPFIDILKLKLNISSPQTIEVNVYDMLGRLVAAEKPALYNSSVMFNLKATANLKPGTYILKINTVDEQRTYKIVKQ